MASVCIRPRLSVGKGSDSCCAAVLVTGPLPAVQKTMSDSTTCNTSIKISCWTKGEFVHSSQLTSQLKKCLLLKHPAALQMSHLPGPEGRLNHDVETGFTQGRHMQSVDARLQRAWHFGVLGNQCCPKNIGIGTQYSRASLHVEVSSAISVQNECVDEPPGVSMPCPTCCLSLDKLKVSFRCERSGAMGLRGCSPIRSTLLTYSSTLIVRQINQTIAGCARRG